MRILALDPASRCGWAFSTTKDRVEASGVWLLGSDDAVRPGRLAEYLRLAIAKHQPAVVAYEAATYGSRHLRVIRQHNELAGAIRATCLHAGVECWEFGIGTWKARTVGSGRAKKPAVLRGLATYFGIEVVDQDQADAIGICLAAQLGPPPPPKRKARSAERKRLKKLPRLF